MTVNNSGFPSPFIISTFEIRVFKLEKLVVYHLHGQPVVPRLGLASTVQDWTISSGFAFSTNRFHLKRNCFRSMKLILKDSRLYHYDLENRTLTFKKFECSGKFPSGTTGKAAVMHSLFNQIFWKPFVKQWQ